jgi:hypothetical protein
MLDDDIELGGVEDPSAEGCAQVREPAALYQLGERAANRRPYAARSIPAFTMKASTTSIPFPAFRFVNT